MKWNLIFNNTFFAPYQSLVDSPDIVADRINDKLLFLMEQFPSFGYETLISLPINQIQSMLRCNEKRMEKMQNQNNNIDTSNIKNALTTLLAKKD